MKKEMTSTVMKTLVSTIKKANSSKRKRGYDADDDDESSNKQSSDSLYNILSQSDSVMMMTVTPSPIPSKWNSGSFSCMMMTGSDGDDVNNAEMNEELTQDADNVEDAEDPNR
jgi:hypothetical protein